jgi:hypothetical protein
LFHYLPFWRNKVNETTKHTFITLHPAVGTLVAAYNVINNVIQHGF